MVFYVQNRAFANGGVSPHKLYFRKKPNLAHLRVFGSIAYVHVPKEKRRKLDAKSKKCILVDYSDEQKVYKCYKTPNRTGLSKSLCRIRRVCTSLTSSSFQSLALSSPL